MPESIEVKAISMYPKQWSIVDQVNTAYEFRNNSQAVRFIVSEYGRLKETYESTGGAKEVKQ